MRVLALDAATEACSVAILTESGLVGRFAAGGRGHAEQILRMVDDTLAEAGLTLGMLDGIAAGVGPGAFTGVRISVSVAQGLAFGAGLPVIGISTLEGLALQALRGGATEVMACLDARMGEVYWGCFTADAERGLCALGPPHVGTPAAAMAAAVAAWGGAVRAPATARAFDGIGRGFAAYAELRALPGLRLTAGALEALPDARDMARLGAIRLTADEGHDPADLTPLYLRDKVAQTEIERAAVRAGN